jgi:hypothetical protein
LQRDAGEDAVIDGSYQDQRKDEVGDECCSGAVPEQVLLYLGLECFTVVHKLVLLILEFLSNPIESCLELAFSRFVQ